MLSVERLRSGYGKGDVLHGVSIDVRDGEVVGIMGRNGVGKTTLMRSVIGLLPLRSGRLSLEGRDITALSADQRARRGIGYVPQGREIFPRLTVAENLRVGEQIRRDASDVSYDLVYDYFPILEQRSRQRGGTLSGGQQQMLAIGRALVGGPRLLMLDEPSEGVQPSIVQEIGRSIAKLNADRGLTTIVVDQNLELIQSVAHRGYVMDKGQIVAELSEEDIQDTKRVTELLAL